ncbi:trehalose-6-phosphate synthase [Amaricoccus sp.]|uniref:alpha,alpha-trehalose-phosphate synthase (UDP-forming) n=1 Tax=Amaricoccus sp. TaxID=1872485 RepID=UPI002616CF32|nr:trehalose-6-phosphate synthase [Amaricoccus sp.]HRO11915.1 trehalose-6-phosphate synthase [Amaricoccus sp.]
METPGESRAGGLAVALRDALAQRGGVWFGWSGDTVERETRGVRHFTEGNVEFALADLTLPEYEGYYLGYANRALWPVFHYRVDLAHFDESDFAAYEQVNRRFARLLAPFTRPDDMVWVHDYHFLLMGQELRASGWRGRMGFFLHVPFPAPEVFSALPQHQRLALGLAAFDLVGFQTDRDTANFRRYLVENAGAEILEDGRLRVFDQVLRAATFSIGVDPDDVAAQAEGEEGVAAAARVGKITDHRALVIGVDRMDYSKGLPQRMEAFGRMLDDHEELRGRVSFLQIAPPSRESVDAYQVLREELDRLAGRINADYADLDWMPIRYLARSYDRGTLCGLYRLARVGLVTPLHDGMNLVAKEFVAAQTPEDPGVLVLSEFAGAAEQMQAALLVNPHDIAATADAIHRALSMPREERIERWQDLIRNVQEHDIAWWRRSFLDALEASAGVPA